RLKQLAVTLLAEGFPPPIRATGESESVAVAYGAGCEFTPAPARSTRPFAEPLFAWLSVQDGHHDDVDAPGYFYSRSGRKRRDRLANKLYFVSRYAPRAASVIDASGANFVGDRWDLPGECASANLLLIGSPSENAWTSLDLVFSQSEEVAKKGASHSEAFRRSFILDGTSYSANGTGLLAVGPLPSRKLALLVHGTDEKGADFLVLGSSAAWKGEGGILAAGYLTPLWQISSSGWAEPEHPFEGGGGLGSTPAAHCSVEMEAITKSDMDLEGNFWPRSGGSVQRVAAAVAAVPLLTEFLWLCSAISEITAGFLTGVFA
ncbi:unnamed protein product, partial [Symbiodinium sp. KB8]